MITQYPQSPEMGLGGELQRLRPETVEILTSHPPADVRDSQFLQLAYQTPLETIALAGTGVWRLGCNDQDDVVAEKLTV
jgi:hypothetical protein